MAKKRPAPKPKPRPNFPPLLVLEGEDADGPWIVAIRGVDYMPIGEDSDSPQENRCERDLEGDSGVWWIRGQQPWLHTKIE